LHILVEPSDYLLRNAGDMAMLQVALERFSGLWPDAKIQVLSDDPENLAMLSSAAVPLSGLGREILLTRNASLLRALGRVAPVLTPFARPRSPKFVERILRLRRNKDHPHIRSIAAFTAAVRDADVIVVTGMGGITDGFPAYADGVLEALDLALASGPKVVAMVGQGIGPLERPDLRAKASAVLPRLNLIAVREKRTSVPLLRSLGVPADRIVVTGDDAVALAYDQRAEGGSGIGLNVRQSPYSAVDDRSLSAARAVIASFAAEHAAPLIPVPISFVPDEMDLEAVARNFDIDDAEVRRAIDLRRPADVIKQIQRCRVVITGSYHAAVFALSTGIPAIGLARSSYYIDKFCGLADMFGAGCEVVQIDTEGNYAPALQAAMTSLWENSDRLRPSLYERAAQQIAAGKAAYALLKTYTPSSQVQP